MTLSVWPRVKAAIVDVIGRERANRLSGPLYDWHARRCTRRRLASLPRRDLLVNLGCGYHILPGWINLDYSRVPNVDLMWDMADGLPFPHESCAALFCEHVIEHLPRETAPLFLGECRRVLQREGVLRISTPDAERFLRAYVEESDFFNHPGFETRTETRMDRINLMMRENGQHLWCYDVETLSLLLRREGFTRVVEQRFGESLDPRMHGIDLESRAFESLYLEAVK